jgi:hypothetical protein
VGGGFCEPLSESDTTIERWIHGESRLHIDVWVRPRLSDVDPLKFCAWLENNPSRPSGDFGDGAINGFAIAKLSTDWENPGRADVSVLVVCRQTGKRSKAMKNHLPLAVNVGLIAPDECPVCSSQAGKSGLDLVVEVVSVKSNGEVHPAPSLLGKRPGRSALNESPRDVVEARAEVISDVANAQAKTGGEGFDGLDPKDYAVALGVVFGPGDGSGRTLQPPASTANG